MKMLLPVLLMLATGKTILPGEVKVKTLPPESREVLDYLPRNIGIDCSARCQSEAYDEC